MERNNIIKERDYIISSGKTSEELDKEIEKEKETMKTMKEWPVA